MTNSPSRFFGPVSLVSTLALLAACTEAARAQTVLDLGVLPGGTYSLGGSISADGTVVTGQGDIPGDSYRGWRWTAATGKVSIGVTPGSDHSYAYGLSGNGQVVIGASGGAAYDTASRWTAATGNQTLGSISPGMPSFASDASFDGSVVIGYGYIGTGEERAFRWTSAAGMRAFGQLLPGTSHSVGLACNADASMVTGYCFNNAPALIYPTACVWNAGGQVVSLGVLAGSIESVPGAMSADGSAVVGYCADAAGGVSRAFRWTAATGMQDLGVPPGSAAAVAASVTADGGTVVGYGVTGVRTRACIWTGASGMRDLAEFLTSRGISVAGWTLDTAAISADGSALTGTGTRNGTTRAWYVSLGCAAPVIGTQPVSQTVVAGSPVTFSVGATGGGLTYQWRRNGGIIQNARGSSYSIGAATLSDAGDYSCDIVGACGSASSAVATLTVTAGCVPPEITQQPADQTVCHGSRVEIMMTSTGTEPMRYQWRRDGVEIDGATDAVLVIENATAGDSGAYDCVLSNDCGDTDSDAGVLAVEACAPCPADFNADGGVDGGDVESFYVAWEAGDAAADVNADGGIDGGDVETFFLAWEAGGC